MLRNVQHCSFIWLGYCCFFHSPVTCLECGNKKKKKRECMCHVLQIQMLIQALVYQIRLKPLNENSEC